MEQYKVVEKFVSINGEGKLAGQLAIFIRFAGCNLNCSYCDTTWANEAHVKYESMTAEEIIAYIKSTKVRNITLTGGEPLKQEGMHELLVALSKQEDIAVEIETNGSIALKDFIDIENNKPSFTMDYKLKSSGMEARMLVENFNYLEKKDTVKFVVGSEEDLIRAKAIIDEFSLIGKCGVYLSPVYGKIDMKYMVEFMKGNNLNGVNLQIQMHKVIWAPEERGV